MSRAIKCDRCWALEEGNNEPHVRGITKLLSFCLKRPAYYMGYHVEDKLVMIDLCARCRHELAVWWDSAFTTRGKT